MKNNINKITRIIALLTTLALCMISLNISGHSEGINVRYIDKNSSAQSLNYIVYAPSNVSADTPIFLFLHGDGEAGASLTKVAKHYKFLRAMIDGSWQPNFIFVMPISTKKGNWENVHKSVNIILDEVVKYFGGSKNNMYIGGASAGSDAVIYYQKDGQFKGSIQMAGHVGDKYGKVSPETVMQRWSGKKLWYFRDNLRSDGGYGCDPNYLFSCAQLAPSYNVNFQLNDLNWDHSYGLVDRVFLPSNMTDTKGQNGIDAITNLIYY